MNGSIYLQWHYLAFLAPAGASALLLLLSGLRLGGHRGHHHGGTTSRHAGTAHGAKHAAPTAKHATSGPKRNATRSDGAMVHGTAEFLLTMVGFRRVPPLLFLQMFFLCGGLAGFWANRLLLGETEPAFLQWLPCLIIAVVVGAIFARLGAELVA